MNGFAKGPRVTAGLRVLAALFVALLPFAACNILTPVIGEFGLNLAFPVFLPLAVGCLTRLRFSRPPPLIPGSKCEALMTGMLLFFIWCAVNTILTGILFELRGIEAYGFTPAYHSLLRVPVPLVLGALLFVSYQVGAFILPLRSLDRILCFSVAVLSVYGCVQLYALGASPPWYFSFVAWLEAARARPGPWQPEVVSYVHLTGRLNLTAFEGAEAARLLLILYIPVLVTPRARRFTPGRIVLIVASLGAVLATQSIVGLACLVVLGCLATVVAKRRILVFGLLAGLLLLASILLLPTGIGDRLNELTRTHGAGDGDQSAVTRAATAIASLRVAAEHPLLGIGWAKELFFVPATMPSWGYTSEVDYSIGAGQALSAKSMTLRLLLYAGAPALGIVFVRFLRALRETYQQYRKTGNPLLLRAVIVMSMFALAGTLDGGILGCTYSWAALGIALGLAARALSEPGTPPPLEAQACGY